jgi:2,4-dienoyl-CoA reductase-like NADH-dependent reductase (Old Yellow Enzyme family)/thioredoxin reductase
MDAIFQTFDLGALRLPNRVVMTTVKLGYGTKEGKVTDRHLAFYARRARGGVGLLTTEPQCVLPNGRELPTQLAVHDDAVVEGLTNLTKAVHGEGGRIMAHLNHAGRAANPKLVPEDGLVSASSVLCPANQVVPRPLTVKEIAEVVGAFASAARRIRKADFDAIEIPFSHGYLIHQFLSPHTNQRNDEYGGDFEGRVRFGMEVLGAVRDQVGGTLPIVVRMNAQDYVDGGLGPDDALQLAQLLASSGVNALSVTSGTMCESVPFCLYPAGTPKAHLLPMAARIREAAGIPVIVAGRIRTPKTAGKALLEEQADLIGLGRPLLADPDWVKKAESGDAEAILLCAACHQGCLGELRKGNGTHCLFNPSTGRELDGPAQAASKARKVMVVGGGPAGLEAARVAANRGHEVCLYEEKDHLGGQAHLAARVPHKEGFLDALGHMELMARRAGVRFRLGTRITLEDIRNLTPDTVVLATGAVPLTVAFPGLDQVPWVLADEVLAGDVEVDSPTALVVGGGLVGLETADFLGARGVKVTLVEMRASVGETLDLLPRTMLRKRLSNQGAEIHVNTEVVAFSPGEVEVIEGGESLLLPLETAIIAVGARPDRTLAEALAGQGFDLHLIGDAVDPRGIGEAIWEANQVAAEL